VDQLFAIAALERSPDPQQLVNEAIEQIEKHPLLSIFGTSHFDREGKVVYRSEGGGFGDRDNDPAIQQQIAQAESIRRRIAVGGRSRSHGSTSPATTTYPMMCWLRFSTTAHLRRRTSFGPFRVASVG
jgi:hypothetical protein